MAENKERGSGVFNEEERAAMKERVGEVRAEHKGGKGAEKTVLKKIAKMAAADRAIAERIHAIVTEVAPELEPKMWYGQPAYARNGKIVVFFQAASKFKTRYATLGFQEDARLDDGDMWATSFAVLRLTPDVETRIRELVTKAAG